MSGVGINTPGSVNTAEVGYVIGAYMIAPWAARARRTTATG
jgi:hypothetical protein